MIKTKSINPYLIIAESAVVAIGIFILDLMIPLGVAGGVPYVALVAIGRYAPWSRYIIYLAIVSTVLTVLGFYLSTPLGIPWMVITNRILALFAIWVTAGFCLSSKRLENELREHQEHLDELVNERTSELSRVNEQLREETKERKRLQQSESRAQRLELAGTIAGQVAHDFNNLLAPLLAYPEFIREELPHDHSALPYLYQIEEASQKIADINQDLLAMGRRGHYNRVDIDLNNIIRTALKDLEPYPDTLVCKTELSDDLCAILGGNAQLHRMINNLLHNARDAMQDKGQIFLKTENYFINDVSILCRQIPKGEYVKLTISDTGIGIPDDILQKIFDPFFTSKIADKVRGSGLGLSVVDSVVKDHDGYIDVSTKLGEGTSFYIYFPISRNTIESRIAKEIRGGCETILVVDDDDIQREVTSLLLKKLGYKISSVRSGEEAIEFIRMNQQDLLILDMVMPGGIDGTETYARILELNPHQKAILLSGFSESDRVVEAQRLGAGVFVQKPVTKSIIASAVRLELDTQLMVVAD